MDSRKMNGFADERAVDDSGAKAAAQTQTQGGQDLSTYTKDDAAALWSRDALWETNAQVRDLSVQLFKNAADAKQNAMISPTSILLAMAMVENGAAGDTKNPLYILTIAGVVNVILNLFFVIVCRLGVAGVALASAISLYLSAGLILLSLIRSANTYALRRSAFRICQDKARQLLRFLYLPVRRMPSLPLPICSFRRVLIPLTR